MQRLGVMFTCNRPPEELIDGIRLIEHLGFDDAWVVEDLRWGGGIASSVAALAATDRVRVGLGIMPVLFRNPAATAMEVSTVARLYPNRFVAGIGHGVGSWMAQVGLAQKSPLRAIEEVTTNVRALIRGEQVSFAGDVVTLDDIALVHPAKVVPPVMLGVVGPKSLHLSGRIADGTIVPEWCGPGYLTQARATIDHGRSAAGRTDSHELVVFVNTMLSNEHVDARLVMRQTFGPRILNGASDSQLGPELLHEVLAIRARCTTEADAVDALPDHLVDELAAAGTADQVQAAISNVFAAGADTVVLIPFVGPLDPDLRPLAEVVRPVTNS
jgi:5,10-methylenetetrahydromethanopterin reductase